MLDALLSRYGDISVIKRMPFEDGFALYKKAVEKNQERQLWEMWLAKYTHMDKTNYISFQDFKAKALRTVTPAKKSTAEIISLAEKIKAADQSPKGVSADGNI